MEKSSEKKRSQKRVNLKEIMRERLNLFQDWLYIGKPELMREYFSSVFPNILKHFLHLLVYHQLQILQA